jgi:integrase/recombinase XerC
MPPEFAPYLESLRVQRRLAPRTLALYGAALLKLQTGCADLGSELLQLRPAQARELLAQLHGGGLSPRTLALTLSAWRGFYKWLAHERRIDHDPLVGVRAPRAGRPLPKALAVDDAVALAESVTHTEEEGDVAATRDRCIIELLYGAGLRVSELVGLDLQEGAAGVVDLQNQELRVLGKGGKRRAVPLGAQALAAVKAWLAVRPEWARPDEAALLVGRRGARFACPGAMRGCGVSSGRCWSSASYCRSSGGCGRTPSTTWKSGASRPASASSSGRPGCRSARR